LSRTYIHGKQRLGPLYHEIGSDRPAAVAISRRTSPTVARGALEHIYMEISINLIHDINYKK
jgi:hypothetical protein